jgi:hypothetical protein
MAQSGRAGRRQPRQLSGVKRTSHFDRAWQLSDTDWEGSGCAPGVPDDALFTAVRLFRRECVIARPSQLRDEIESIAAARPKPAA